MLLLNSEIECAVVCDVDDEMRPKGLRSVSPKRGKKPT